MPKKTPNSKVDLRYGGVKIDYDTESNCDLHGCDGYCRCSSIQNARATEVNLERVAQSICHAEKVKDDISIYCVERILTIFKKYETDSYEVNTCGGYYGEEIESAVLTSHKEFDDALSHFFQLVQPAKKIEYILKLEYNNVLPEVSNKDWAIKIIDKDLLILGSDSQKKMVKKKDVSMYKDRTLPCGIVIKKGKKYRLIDGYHRVMACENDKICMIIGT